MNPTRINSFLIQFFHNNLALLGKYEVETIMEHRRCSIFVNKK